MMTATMADCALSMVTSWEAQLANQQKERVTIELSDQFEELTADVISHTAFGSSYKEGKRVFQALKELQFIAFSTLFNVHIPGFRYLPTKKNMRVWKLDKEVRSTLTGIIENRLAAKDKAGYGNDLLGLMLEACAPEHGGDQLLSMDEIIDECKTFFFAGQETTSHLLTWVMFLLSTHPEWQDKLRAEVLRECGGGRDRRRAPTHDMLSKLKLVCLSSCWRLSRRLVGVLPSHSRVMTYVPADEPVHPGDAEAVQPGPADPAADAVPGGAGRRGGAGGRAPDAADRDDAPRQGGVGRRRRRVQPAAVRRRHHQGGAQEPERDAGLLQRAEELHRPELRHGRVKGRGRRGAAAVQAHAVAGVRARADRRHHAAPQVRAPHDRHEC